MRTVHTSNARKLSHVEGFNYIVVFGSPFLVEVGWNGRAHSSWPLPSLSHSFRSSLCSRSSSRAADAVCIAGFSRV